MGPRSFTPKFRKVSEAEVEAAPRAMIIDEKSGKIASKKVQAKYSPKDDDDEDDKHVAKKDNRETKKHGDIEITRYKDDKGRQVIEGKNLADNSPKPSFWSRLLGRDDDQAKVATQRPAEHQESTGNQSYKDGYANAPANWGRAVTAAAVDEARAGKIVYQEQKMVGSTSYGTMSFVDLDGKMQRVRVFSGGAGNGALPGTSNGTNAQDPRHNGQTIYEYNMSKLEASGSIGPWFRITDQGGRTELGMHKDFGQDGKSKGCPNWHPADTKIIDEKLKPLLDQRGNMKMVMEPTLDRNNRMANHKGNDDRTRELAQNFVEGPHNSQANGSKPSELPQNPNHERMKRGL